MKKDITLIIVDLIIGPIGIIAHAICIYGVLKMKSLQNGFGYIVISISVFNSTLIILSLNTVTHLVTLYPDENENVTIAQRIYGMIQMFCWKGIFWSHLLLSINRLMAVFAEFYYFQHFTKQIAKIYTSLIWIIAFVHMIPYMISADCTFYFEPVYLKEWTFIESPCKFWVATVFDMYPSFIILGLSFIFDILILLRIHNNTKQAAKHQTAFGSIQIDKKRKRENIYAFQCVAVSATLLFNEFIFHFFSRITIPGLDYSVVANIQGLVYLSSFGIIIIFCNGEMRAMIGNFAKLVGGKHVTTIHPSTTNISEQK